MQKVFYKLPRLLVVPIALAESLYSNETSKFELSEWFSVDSFVDKEFRSKRTLELDSYVYELYGAVCYA